MSHIFWITFLPSVTVMLSVQWIGRRMMAKNKKFASEHSTNWRKLRSLD